MASSPSSTPGRRNRPGCMSGIAHLFDFNQALAGRKLLTDRKYEAGLDALRNTPNGDMEQFKSKASSGRQTEFTRSASVSRRSVDVSMKTLIAEEFSQEPPTGVEPKSRAPNVVARLMGLDALPSDRSREQSTSSVELGNTVQKVPSDRLQHSKVPGHNSSRGFKSIGPPTRSVSDLSSSRRSSWEEHTSMFDSPSSQSRLREKEPKEIFDPWKDWKSEDCARMQALDDLDTQLAAKQMLIKKKLSEAKLGLLSKHNAPQAKLYESKEFMDAIDFLQANKDFFARFLEQPDSLFAKHLINSEGKPILGKVEEAEKNTKRRSFKTLENAVTAQDWRKEPPDLQQSPQGTYTQAFSTKAQERHVKSAKYSVSSNGDCQQAPTRIVVLKPGPGKVRNLMSLSQNSPRSPREFFDAMEVVKENSLDVLQDLKCKLQQEDARGHPRKAWTSVSDHSMPSRDPREIAREIARQVRENVSKDMRNSKKGPTNETGLGSKMQLSEIGDDNSNRVNASHRGSGMVLGRDQPDEAMSNLSNQGLDRKILHGGKGEPRRSLDHIFLIGNDAHLKGPQNTASRSNHRRGDRGSHHKYRSSRVHGVDDIYKSQNHSAVETDVDCDTDSCSHSVCESEADAYARSGNAACITLLRSRSVPTSCSSFHEEVEEMDPRMVRNGFFVADEAKVVDIKRSFDAGIHQSGSFRRKRPVLKSSLSNNKTYVRELEEMSIPMQELPTQKSHPDACAEHEKVQHQIDDTGPILDSDSSVSSLDNFLTLEAALIAEDVDGIKLPAEATSPTVGNALPRKPKNLSPGESPNTLINLPDAEPMSADHETSKDPPEQPSPVSVLEAPFREEPASPMDFTEISSGLQELRIRLQLLKFVDQEAVSIQEEYQEEDCEFMDDNRTTSNCMHSMVNDIDCPSHHMEDSLLVDGILWPQGREPELLYVKSLLAISGFTIDSTSALTRWHSPSQPLAAWVFEKVETSFHSCASDNVARKEGGLDAQTRHLLFDIVNEVLLEVLGPHVNRRTWWKCTEKSSIMPHGKDLVGQVWSRVSKLLHSQSEAQDTLGSLVAEDLANKNRWWDFSIDIEIVILEVEKSIWSDLVEEMLYRY